MPNPIFQNPHLDGHSFFLAGDDTAVLLLHGLTATTVEVRCLAEYVNQHGIAVSAPLLPGHGTTPGDLHSKSWKDWASAVNQSYLELADKYSRVFVGGESLGGLLALYLAENHPEISGLVLFAPALTLMGSWRAPLLMPFIKTIPKTHSGVDEIGHLPWQGYTVVSVPSIYQLRKLQKTVSDKLSTIQQPTLIFQGRLDLRVNPTTTQTIFNRISARQKELVWLNKSGHCIILDIEREFVYQKTLAFILSGDV